MTRITKMYHTAYFIKVKHIKTLFNTFCCAQNLIPMIPMILCDVFNNKLTCK